MLVQGASYKEIASARQVAVKTVDHQLQCLYKKFAVRSRGELADMCWRGASSH
jgi:DNA-binding NarL/FixJ family response regulator